MVLRLYLLPSVLESLPAVLSVMMHYFYGTLPRVVNIGTTALASVWSFWIFARAQKSLRIWDGEMCWKMPFTGEEKARQSAVSKCWKTLILGRAGWWVPTAPLPKGQKKEEVTWDPRPRETLKTAEALSAPVYLNTRTSLCFLWCLPPCWDGGTRIWTPGAG